METGEWSGVIVDLTTADRTVLAAVARVLTVTEKFLVSHDRLLGMSRTHVLNIGVVIGHTDH